MSLARNWIKTNLGDTKFFKPLGTGIERFSGVKDYLSTSSIDGTRIVNVEEEVTFSHRPSRANLQPVQNTVWFARMRDTQKVLESNNYLCEHAILSTGFCGIQSDKVSSSFLKQYLLSNIFERQKDRYAEGSTQVALSNEKLGLIEIDFPISYFEQSKIAEILSSVDRAIDQTEALIAKQRRIETGTRRDLLARGIDENGILRSNTTHTFRDSLAGQIPAEWEESTIGEIGKWFSGGTPPKGNSRYWNGEIPWVCPKDMKKFEISSSIETITDFAVETGTRLMPIGTVFIVIRGMILAHTFPVGYATKPMAFNQDVKAVITNKSLVGRYLAYWLDSHSNKFLKLTTVATHGTKRFDMDEIFSIPIGFPLKDEQKRILNIMDQQQALIEQMLLCAQKLRSLKTGLMQDLLTCKVPITPLLNKAETAA